MKVNDNRARGGNVETMLFNGFFQFAYPRSFQPALKQHNNLRFTVLNSDPQQGLNSDLVVSFRSRRRPTES